jgi:hypothetical protein
MTILKPLRDKNYEHYFIQTLYQKGQLIPEQSPGEENPIVQLAIHHTHIPLYKSQ